MDSISKCNEINRTMCYMHTLAKGSFMDQETRSRFMLEVGSIDYSIREFFIEACLYPFSTLLLRIYNVMAISANVFHYTTKLQVVNSMG